LKTCSIAALARQRWQPDLPFAGHTGESLERKIASTATREEVREAARGELKLRETIELPSSVKPR
jgi:hypothetical protein